MKDLEKAKELFLLYEGNGYLMAVDGVWDEYKSYNISEELENTWNLEFIKTKELLKKEGE